MTKTATCPVCSGKATTGSDCRCGYLRMNAAGDPFTQMQADPEAYRYEPNLLVVEGDEDDTPAGGKSMERSTPRSKSSGPNSDGGEPKPMDDKGK